MTGERQGISIQINLEGKKVVIGRLAPLRSRPKHPLSLIEEAEKQALENWWGEQMFEPFHKAAQSWINSTGASIAVNAGLNVEQIGSEMSLDEADSSIRKAFSTARGKHFTSEDLVRFLVSKTHEMEESVSIRRGWATMFAQHVTGLLVKEWGLSSKKTVKLKALTQQRKLPQF